MTTSQKTSTLSSMTTHQMFTLWSQEKWVRNLVLLLTPIGFIDAIYTVLLFNALGPSFEYNPLVRAALESPWWFVWFLIDALSFFLFIMMAGSYYLHTRTSLVRNRTGIVSGLVALRVGAAAHNLIRFYGIYSAFLGGFLVACITYVIMDSLLDRTSDVSWKGFKQWWRHKYDGFHDRRLIQSAKKTERGDETQVEEQTEEEMEVELPTRSRHWGKRVLYLLIAVSIFIFMPFFLVKLAEWSGAAAWTEEYGPLVFWNAVSGSAFILGFIAICFFTATIMYFILKSFEADEGSW